MTDVRFFDRSKFPEPKGGLPGTFAFVPRPYGFHDLLIADAVKPTLDWCEEQFGTPQPLRQGAHHEERLIPGAWGFWPSGAVFFTEVAQAMWFKLRWG